MTEARLLLKSEAAEYLGCSERQVTNLTHLGLRKVKLGRSVRFFASDVEEFARAQQREQEAEHAHIVSIVRRKLG